MKKIVKNPYIQFIIFGFCLSALPLLGNMGILKSSSIVLVGGVLIYSVAALGLNLLLGYSGLISLGTAGFMGLGAYLSAWLTENLNLPFLLSLVIAVLVPVFIGVLVGLVSLRIEGLYLAIATLCVSEILRKTFEELDFMTNGFSGKSASFPSFFGKILSRDGTYWFIVIVLVLVMILCYNLVNGQMGRALHAMRGSEVAAQAMGINLLKYRLVAFALATGYAALSGVLYVHFIKFSYPSVWILGMSLNILAVIIIGGARSIYGTVLGAFIVFGVPDLILKQLPVIGSMNGVSYIFNGILIILIIMFYPQGIVHLVTDVKNFIVKRIGGGKRDSNAGK